MLGVIQKILSKIFMDRTENKINKHLSQSQSACRKSRSTTNVIWAHRWMAAETQVQAIFITGIDMSSAIDTIYRDELFKIVEEFLDEDDLRILSVLLVKTTLEVKVENAQATTFESNIGSPQGDSISGLLFTLYFNRALQQIKDEMQKEPIDCRDINPRWVEKMESSIPEEIVYADDCDFITEIEKTKDKIYEKAKEIMKRKTC